MFQSSDKIDAIGPLPIIVQHDNLVVNNRNHYFGLGPIPKPKP